MLFLNAWSQPTSYSVHVFVEELHAEACYAECLLQRAALTFLQVGKEPHLTHTLPLKTTPTLIHPHTRQIRQNSSKVHHEHSAPGFLIYLHVSCVHEIPKKRLPHTYLLVNLIGFTQCTGDAAHDPTSQAFWFLSQTSSFPPPLFPFNFFLLYTFADRMRTWWVSLKEESKYAIATSYTSK